MQTSLKKTFARAAREQAPPPPLQWANSNQSTKPSLLRMLSSHMVVRPMGNATDSGALSSEGAPAAALPAPRPAPATQRPAPETKTCPLCGERLPVGATYDLHFAAEAAELAADSDEEWAATISAPPPPPPADEPARPSRPKRRVPDDVQEVAHDGDDDDASAPRVYVLGGAPAVAVPRNPKKLRPLPPGMRRGPRAVATAYNYYADGGGLLDGEALGLDGAENVGVGWEGVGATTF